MRNGSTVTSILSNETTIPVNLENTISMIDGKMVGIIQGDTGGQKCHYCTSTVNDINNIVQILKGYKIDKSYESCMEAWRSVEEGEIDWASSRREGQCHKPLAPVNNFAILHWKLRSFDYVLNILYRLVAGVHVWGKTDVINSEKIKQAKTKTQEHIRQNVGILVDVPTQGGGNTNNGNVARTFFNPKFRHTICSLIEDEVDRTNYNTLLRDINVMLSVCLGLRSDVNVDKLRQLGINIMSHIRTAFMKDGIPWVPINPSLHSMCSHSWELFSMFGVIAIYSEQAQEHWNKYVRNLKSGNGCRARQTSVKLNIHDVFVRMLRMTHPVVVAKQRKLLCTVCGQTGHTARSKMHSNVHEIAQSDDNILDLYLPDE